MKRKICVSATLISLILTLCLLASVFITPATAAEPKEKLSDEKSRKESEITLSDGTSTGVKWSEIMISGSTYGENRAVNMVEFDLANTNLSVEVLNSGKYMVDAKNLDAAAIDYNTQNPGKTVLAAVNGDLWMTSVHSGSSVTKKVLKVPRGVMIVDGEIWASQQIDQENSGATNAEQGTPAGNKAAFGVTSNNQPLIGSPDIQISMKVNGKTIKADGLNRLPATGAIIVYNHRVNDSNYALNDAYEVELEVDETSAFKAGGQLTAKVVAIYESNSETRPAIGEKTILLTARGRKSSELKYNFKVGDTVTFTTTLTDRMGRTELWQDVQEAIGGHMQPIIDGKLAVANGDTTAYPTSFVGYRDDGSVVFCSVTSTLDGSRAALRFSDGYKFCTEMGFNSVFYLDGGGSTTFITLEEGSYTVRNKCSDGSQRAVINGIAVVWNDEKVCEKQGSLSYIKVTADMSKYPATYIDGALMAELVGSPQGVNLSYDSTEKAFKMTTTQTNDPYASLEFGTLAPADAGTYKYIVLKVKNDHPSASTNLTLYYAAGSDKGAAGGRSVTASVKSGIDEWQYVIMDMSDASNWRGNINSLRLDIFDGLNVSAGISTYFGAVVLCKTAEEAAQVANGWTPEGSITDYLSYLESLNPPAAPPEDDTEADTETNTETETESQTEAQTEAQTALTTESPTEAVTEQSAESGTNAHAEQPKKKGCGSTAHVGAALILAALVPAVAVMRKKED